MKKQPTLKLVADVRKDPEAPFITLGRGKTRVYSEKWVYNQPAGPTEEATLTVTLKAGLFEVRCVTPIGIKVVK